MTPTCVENVSVCEGFGEICGKHGADLQCSLIMLIRNNKCEVNHSYMNYEITNVSPLNM